MNWYRPGQWELWASKVCVASPEVPILKTTMIVEFHWRIRTIKHDYLHWPRFNPPRIDLVAWIFIQKVIPDAIHRLNVISGDITLTAVRRLGYASCKLEGWF